MRVCVTGGAGFVCSALVSRLVADGHTVAVLDDFSRGNKERLPAEVQINDGNVCDFFEVFDVFRGCDLVIHGAMVQGTQNFTDNPWKTQNVAVRGTLNVLDACRAHGVRDLMLLSSSEVYQGERDSVPTDESVWLSIPDVLNPRFSYGGGKIAMEMLCSAYLADGSLDRLVIARPHNIYGPDAGSEHIIPQFCERLRALAASTAAPTRLKFPILGTGEETRSYCYISDCVDALTLLVEEAPVGASIWHVGTQDERSTNDVAQSVAECFGREIEIVPGMLAKGSPPRRCPDTTKIETLGYSPKVHFSEGIVKTVDWYRG